FLLQLADAGEQDLAWRDSRSQRALQFAAGDDVGAGAELCQRAQHRLVGVRLHGVAHQNLLAGEGVGEDAIMPLQRRGGVAIEGRADAVCDVQQADRLGVQHAVAIIKVIHGVDNLVAQKRVENKRSFAAFGRGGAAFIAVGRIGGAGRGRARGRGFRGSGGGGFRGVRRQVEAALAAATAERERGSAQHDDGPPRRGQAPLADHFEIPNAGRTIQRLPWSGETRMNMKSQRNLGKRPYFRCFSSRFAQALAWAATFFGAVPPNLVRLFTDESPDSTFRASAVIFGSTSCIALSGSSCRATPSWEARPTMRPVTWWASRNGIFRVRTSQ